MFAWFLISALDILPFGSIDLIFFSIALARLLFAEILLPRYVKSSIIASHRSFSMMLDAVPFCFVTVET